MYIPDMHVPKGDMIKNSVSLINFNSFLLRIREIFGTSQMMDLFSPQHSRCNKYRHENIKLLSYNKSFNGKRALCFQPF